MLGQFLLVLELLDLRDDKLPPILGHKVWLIMRVFSLECNDSRCDHPVCQFIRLNVKTPGRPPKLLGPAFGLLSDCGPFAHLKDNSQVSLSRVKRPLELFEFWNCLAVFVLLMCQRASKARGRE